jgi:hypothetical protein
MKITQELIKKTKQHNKNKWHDDAWHKVNNLPEIEAINYALYRKAPDDTIKDIIEIANKYLSTMSGSKKKTNKKTRKLGHGPGCTKPETLGKHYSGPSKKHLTEKQKKSLAKGRKVLSYLRTGRAAAEPLEPILIKEGRFMAAHKKQKSSKKMHGFEGTRKKGKKVYRKKSHAMHGAGAGFDAGGLAVDLAGLLAGAIGLSFVAGMIPIKNPKLKTLIPLGLGILGLSMPKLSKNRFINRAALGGLAIGGYSLTKQIVPQLPLMGATDTAEGIGYAIQQLPAEEQAILGLLPDYTEQTAAGTDYAGTDYAGTEYAGTQPGEMLGNDQAGTELIQGMPGEMLGEEQMQMIGAESDFE